MTPNDFAKQIFTIVKNWVDVKINELKQSETKTGWTTNQINYLVKILKQMSSYTDLTSDIDALELSLLSGIEGGSETTDGIDVIQNGSALKINAVFNIPVQSDASVLLT